MGEHWIREFYNGRDERADQPRKDPDLPVLSGDDERAQRWISRMLEACADEIAAAPEGQRNHTLNAKAYRVGRFVHGGYIREWDALDQLMDAARACGLSHMEARRTIASGFKGAANDPAAWQLDETVIDVPEAFTVPDEWIPESDRDRMRAAEGDWAAKDLDSILDGTYTEPETGIIVRDDGQGLLYPAHVHWFHGESESGKSWVAQHATAEVLRHGGMACYIDHESNAREVVHRLLSMGVDKEQIRGRLHYIQPEAPVHRDAENFALLLSQAYALVVVDGITDALGIAGAEVNDNDAVAKWMRTVPKPIAARTGAAVVCIDHVTKSTDGRGRFAMGGQHKLAGLDGAAYLVEPIAPLGRGLRGTIALKVAKDRLGVIRPNCGKWDARTRTQEAALIEFDSADGRMYVQVRRPSMDNEIGEDDERAAMQSLMVTVSMQIEDHPGITWRDLVRAIKGNNDRLQQARDTLEIEEYITVDRQARGRPTRHHSLKPFRRSDF